VSVGFSKRLVSVRQADHNLDVVFAQRSPAFNPAYTLKTEQIAIEENGVSMLVTARTGRVLWRDIKST